MSNGCATPAGGPSLIGRDVTKEAVIQGLVQREGQPVGNAYVRLLDSTGEFTAEVPTNEAGEFRFFAGNGDWTLRTLAPKADVIESRVQASVGSITELVVAI
jgi:hypothetical protein